MYKLYCNQDPKALGIEDDKGNWDCEKFILHIKECKQCKRFLRKIKRELFNIFLKGGN